MQRQDQANDRFSVTSFLYGGNASYIEELQARYEKNPDSVDPEWRQFFDGVGDNGPDIINALVIMDSDSGHITGHGGIGTFDMKLEGNGGTDTFSALVGDHSGGNVHFDQSLVTSGAIPILGTVFLPPDARDRLLAADGQLHAVDRVRVFGYRTWHEAVTSPEGSS